MLVFWDRRLVILATPKTGSTAIEMALDGLATIALERPPALKHTPAYRYERFLKPYLERSSGASFTAVALMRAPLSWLGSWYRYRGRDEIVGQPQSTRGISFDAFLDAYMSTPVPDFAAVGSQARFLAGKDGLAVDRVFRYEEIDRFVAFLEDRLDCTIELPEVNVSPKADLDPGREVLSRLRTFCAADFALYDRIA